MTADRIAKLKAGRARALDLLAHPDPAVREPAKRALDTADVALGLLAAIEKEMEIGMSDYDDEPSWAQAAFIEVHTLIARLSAEHPSVEVGKGVLIVALSCLRKALPNKEVAKLLYEAADDYAVRDHE